MPTGAASVATRASTARTSPSSSGSSGRCPAAASRLELAGLSALELASLLASRHVSPVELIDATFARIDKVNPAVNAFAWLRHDAALDDARAAEKRFAGGDARPLEGIPFTAKDLAAIADGPTNEGSRAFEGQRLGVDAGVIARLRTAGAILIGSTTASEFGNRPTTESALFGATRNPWNLERTSGGSSGGGGGGGGPGVHALEYRAAGGGAMRPPPPRGGGRWV